MNLNPIDMRGVHAPAMTRDQALAHLLLHDWEPRRYQQAWAGVYKVGSGLVYQRFIATEVESIGMHHAERFSLVRNIGTTWADLSDECLIGVAACIRGNNL